MYNGSIFYPLLTVFGSANVAVFFSSYDRNIKFLGLAFVSSQYSSDGIDSMFSVDTNFS